MGIPESLREIYIWRKGDGSRGDIPKSEMNLYSDGTLTILDNQNNPKFKVKFQDLFPVSLQNIEFDPEATVSDLQFLKQRYNSSIPSILLKILIIQMLDLETIQGMWEKDCKIDPDNLHTESLNIPSLHDKYHELYNNLKLLEYKINNRERTYRIMNDMSTFIGFK